MASIRKKVDHNLADLYGNTPLHYACRTGEVEFVEALLAGKAHKTANQNDLYPIHMAVESLNPAVVELLKSKNPSNFRGSLVKIPLVSPDAQCSQSRGLRDHEVNPE